MKKKFSILLIMVVAVLTLAVVGYAGWYITRDPKSTDPGNVKAYAVDADEITVALCNATGGNTDVPENIIFGRPNSATSTGWLRFDDTGELDPTVENLTVYVKVHAESAGTYTASIALQGGGSANATGLFEGPTFAAVGAYTTTGCSFNPTGNVLTFGENGGDIVFSVSYNWPNWNGDGTTHTNPFVYFNADSKTKATTLETSTIVDAAKGIIGTPANSYATTTKFGDYAKDYLRTLNTYCNGLEFVITVSE